MDISRLDRPFREQKLSVILSKEEVALIINCAANLKHKTMLSTLHSCGLRRGELLNLKIVDLDHGRNLIRIVQAKGRKDRYVPFSEKLKSMLKEYFEKCKPKLYVFEGQSVGKYAARSIAKVLEQAVAKSGIKREVHLHTLRHSFATHTMVSGTDIQYFQAILGHSNPKRTKISNHVSESAMGRIRRPIEDILDGTIPATKLRNTSQGGDIRK